MKRLLALLVAVAAAISVTASVAVAAPGTRTVHFTAAYSFPSGEHLTCKGERIVTSGENASVRDQETCQVSSEAVPAGKYSIDNTAPDFITTVPWHSDYDGLEAVSGTIMVKSRPDGTQVFQINASY